MKKLIFPVIAVSVLAVCCTKEASVSKGISPAIVNVTDASEGMALAKTTYTGGELITANYAIAGADSIQWQLEDSIPSLPGSDSIYNPGNGGGSDSTYNPGDSTYNPGDGNNGGDSSYIPSDSTGSGNNGGGGSDTTYNPGNDSTYIPADSTCGGVHTGDSGGYIVMMRQGYVELKIVGKGRHILVAKAYRRNTDGSYTFIKKGYIKFSAY